MDKIIQTLHKLGGQSNTKELLNEVVDVTEEIPEEYAKLLKTSRKDNKYLPFAYTFNFAVANLILADFLDRPIRGTVELTEKGRTFAIETFDADKDVRAIANPQWDKKKKQSKPSTQPKEKKEELDEVNDQVDDWRAQFGISIGEFYACKVRIIFSCVNQEYGCHN